MKKYISFCLISVLSLTVFLTAMWGLRARREALAERIAPEILRFHVIANSDSPEDQALKLEVKELLLEEIRLLSEADTASLSKAELCTRILDHKGALKAAADCLIADRGFQYSADLCLEKCEFPEKTYGDMTFPAGTYDAVRVVLGDGGGQNFWCVLYPSLCYLDSTHAVVPDESKELLKALIPEDDFQALMIARHGRSGKNGGGQDLPKLTIRFKFAELLSRP